MIEFICTSSLIDSIPPPIPAGQSLPDWYKALPGSGEGDMRTIKRCMPFFDMMNTGWIMPLAADAYLKIEDDGKRVGVGTSDKDKNALKTILHHNRKQVEGYHILSQPLKWVNYWKIKTPPGVSCLFMPPARQDHNMWAVLPAIVDTDKYASPVNFPFFPLLPDGEWVIPKGEPLIQVIPFLRSMAALPGKISGTEFGDDSFAADMVTRHKTVGSEEGYYRKKVRDKRK